MIIKPQIKNRDSIQMVMNYHMNAISYPLYRSSRHLDMIIECKSL